MNPDQKPTAETSDADGKPAAQPDVGSDRSAPAEEAERGRVRHEPRTPPMEIKEIEQIEDDAPGG
jgi:hypothetical protein